MVLWLGPSSVPAGALGAVSPCAPCAPAGCSIPSLGWHWAFLGTDTMGLLGPGGPVGGGGSWCPGHCTDTAHTANKSSSSSTLPQQRCLLKDTAPGSQDGTLRPCSGQIHKRTGDNGLWTLTSHQQCAGSPGPYLLLSPNVAAFRELVTVVKEP